MSSPAVSLRACCSCAFITLLLVWLAGHAAHAAITATGDVYPNPIVPLQYVSVGSEGIGTLLIDGGSTLESGYVTIGESQQGIGFATVTGPGSAWSFYGGIVGDRGLGRLAVLGGAIVDIPGGNGLRIGEQTGSNGTVAVDGLGSVLRIVAPVEIGRQGTGLLQVSEDAIVDVPSQSANIWSRGRVELDGGLFRTYGLTNYGTIAGQGSLQILSSPARNFGRIEVGADQRLTIGGGSSSPFDSSGSIAANGGEIEFLQRVDNAGAYDNPGEITLRDGVVRFFTSAPGEGNALVNQAVLSALGGMNEVYGMVRQYYEGTTLVTNDSTLIFHDHVYLDQGDFVVHSGSTAQFLAGVSLRGTLSVSIGTEDGPTAVQAIGQTEVFGDLHVSFAEAYTPQVGDIFPLVSGTEIIGQFYKRELPDLPFGMLWQLDQNSSSIQLRIIATPDGDYNGDGMVDAADYTVWSDTRGSSSYLHADGNGNGVVDDGDHAVWKANFGATAWSPPAPEAQGAMPLAAVPEPAAGMLLLVGVMLLARPRPASARKTPAHHT